MQPERSEPVTSRKPAPAIAAALLALAGAATYAPGTSPWSRTRIIELVDALLALATTHGFARSDALRELLVSGTDTEHVRTLTEAAFDEVPLSAILDAIRSTRLYTGQ
jgi:hypothetical protein